MQKFQVKIFINNEVTKVPPLRATLRQRFRGGPRPIVVGPPLWWFTWIFYELGRHPGFVSLSRWTVLINRCDFAVLFEDASVLEGNEILFHGKRTRNRKTPQNKEMDPLDVGGRGCRQRAFNFRVTNVCFFLFFAAQLSCAFFSSVRTNPTQTTDLIVGILFMH